MAIFSGCSDDSVEPAINRRFPRVSLKLGEAGGFYPDQQFLAFFCRHGDARARHLYQLGTVQGSIIARPAALNALVSRDATANPCAAAIAAM